MRGSFDQRLTPSGTTHRLASSGYWSSTPASVSSSTAAVVDAGAHDDLAVHLDVVVEQGPQPAQARGAPPVAQQVGAHVGVGGVDADVQRRQPLGDDPLEVGLGEAGQRREVAVEERQPVVVVLQVEALAHARRQLVDEAELAVVVAGADLVEQRRVHLDAERLAVGLGHLDQQLEPAPVELERRVGLVDQQPVLDDVARRPPGDRHDEVTDEHAGARGRTPGRDSDDSWKGHGRQAYRGRVATPLRSPPPRGRAWYGDRRHQSDGGATRLGGRGAIEGRAPAWDGRWTAPVGVGAGRTPARLGAGRSLATRGWRPARVRARVTDRALGRRRRRGRDHDGHARHRADRRPERARHRPPASPPTRCGSWSSA